MSLPPTPMTTFKWWQAEKAVSPTVCFGITIAHELRDRNLLQWCYSLLAFWLVGTTASVILCWHLGLQAPTLRSWLENLLTCSLLHKSSGELSSRIHFRFSISRNIPQSSSYLGREVCGVFWFNTIDYVWVEPVMMNNCKHRDACQKEMLVEMCRDLLGGATACCSSLPSPR